MSVPLKYILTTLAAAAIAVPAAIGGPLEETFARMDRASAGLMSLQANLRRAAHTAVLNEDDVETGAFLLKRGKAHDVRVLFDIKTPEPKQYAIDLHKVEVYLPREDTVQEYDISKYKDLAEQFLLLGFGTTSKELLAAYNVSLVGVENIGNEKTTRLQLIPKSKEMLAHLLRVDLWISDSLGVPIQQKFYTPGDNYNLCTYSDVMKNPNLPDSAVRLNLPKGTKREHPLK